MAKNLLVFITAIFILTGCKQRKITSLPQQISTNKSNFFPVTQYILGQIKELESLPVTPLKITNINGKIDSTWIKKEEAKLFTQAFLTPVIDSITWYKYFSEKSFLDQTLNAITFSYDPIKPLPDSIQLRRWDIYVDPDREKVKRIYIVKQLNTTPTQTIQLTWKSDNFCKITTITEKPNSQPAIKEEKLIWNFND